jgi:hypothetical protein
MTSPTSIAQNLLKGCLGKVSDKTTAKCGQEVTNYNTMMCWREYCPECKSAQKQALIDNKNEKDFLENYVKKVGKPLYPEIFSKRLTELSNAIKLLDNIK